MGVCGITCVCLRVLYMKRFGNYWNVEVVGCVKDKTFPQETRVRVLCVTKYVICEMLISKLYFGLNR